MDMLKKFSLLLLSLFLVGCPDEIESQKLNKETWDQVFALQNPFGSNLVRLSVPAKTDPVLIGLKNCKVYRAQTQEGIVTEWIRLSSIDSFYPLPSACSRESIELDGAYVVVSFCKTPFSAGGGCAGGIDPHRSINGEDWEVLATKNKWKPIAKP